MHPTRHRRPGRALTIVLVAVVAVAAGAAAGYFLAGRLPRPDSNAVRQEGLGPATGDKVTALGRLQPEGGVVPVYGPPGDHIAKLHPLTPGAALKPGDPI